MTSFGPPRTPIPPLRDRFPDSTCIRYAVHKYAHGHSTPTQPAPKTKRNTCCVRGAYSTTTPCQPTATTTPDRHELGSSRHQARGHACSEPSTYSGTY